MKKPPRSIRQDLQARPGATYNEALVSIGISPKLNLRRYILNQVWARDEHDKVKSFEQQLDPGYPVRLKTKLLGNQDKRHNLVLDLTIHSYLRTRHQYNIEQVFQALRFYEHVHAQEHKEK
jgi:hypothetical protein